MNLPILGTLSTLFTDAGNEFRKLFDAWALVAAAVFLGLALGFFYLPLRERVPLLRTWEAWSTTWQALLATLILFALAYLINSLSASFLTLAGGRPLRHSPVIGRALLWLQKRRYQALRDQTQPPRTEAANRAYYQLAYEFPSGDSLALTRLGNIRAAAGAYSMNQYGAHLETVWPLVALTLADKDEKLGEQLSAEQTATTFLATVGILLTVVALVAAPVALAQAAWWRAAGTAALLGVAYGVYRAAAVRALAWGRLIRAGLDLYLDDAGASLGLRSLAADPKEAKTRWEEVSKWLAYGGLLSTSPQEEIPKAKAKWYEKPAAPAPKTTVTPSAGVWAVARVGPPSAVSLALSASEARLVGPQYDVVVVAARAVEGATPPAAATLPPVAAPSPPAGGPGLPGPAVAPLAASASPAGGFVLVADTRLPYLPAAVADTLSGTLYRPNWTALPVNAFLSPGQDEPDALVWPLPGLADDAAVLRYTIGSEVALRGGAGVALLSVRPAPSNPPDQLVVTLRYSGPPLGRAVLTAEPISRERAGKTFQWAVLAGGVPGPPTEAAVVHDPAARRATLTIPGASPGDYFVVLTLTEHGLD